MKYKNIGKMAVVIKTEKDAMFSSERPYMVVTYVRDYNSRLAIGAVANAKYETKYDLRLGYPQFWHKETLYYDAEAAASLFTEEFPIGSKENVNLFDFTIKELTDSKHIAIKDHYSQLTKDIWHVACYYTEKEIAKKIALKEIESKICEKRISWVD